MIIPGTTVAISLIPGYVEVRDKGRVEKKIKIKNRSFADVEAELVEYFRIKGKRLPSGIIRESLIRIGVPEVRVIITDTEPEEKVAILMSKVSVQKVSETPQADKPVSTIETDAISPRIGAEEVSEQLTRPQHTVEPPARMRIEGSALVGEEIEDIERALSLVEKMSDSFIEPRTTEEAPAQTVSVSIQGTEDVLVATGIHASKTTQRSKRQQSVQPTAESRTVETSKTVTAQATEVTTTQPATVITVTSTVEPAEKTKTTTERPAAVTTQERTTTRTPEHVIKPLVDAKVILLGEDGVGKHTLMQKAGFVSQAREDPPQDYVYRRMIELEDYRVRLSAWCFDDAVKAKVSRKDFYGDTDVVIVMYSSADRWSFESVDFWLKESSIILQKMPPILIIGNKIDLRNPHETDEVAQHITTEEGFKFAEGLAKKLAVNEALHPVAFIETSCLVAQGIQESFRTAAELYVRYRLKK